MSLYLAVADDLSDTIVAISDTADEAIRLVSIAGLEHISDSDGNNRLGLRTWQEIRDYFSPNVTEIEINTAKYLKS